MQKTNSSKFIFLILLLPLLLTGCYDRYELDNLAYVVAIGADPGEEGNIDITYQTLLFEFLNLRSIRQLIAYQYLLLSHSG